MPMAVLPNKGILEPKDDRKKRGEIFSLQCSGKESRLFVRMHVLALPERERGWAE
jgi:hypothetical protein